nr:hypothetical protein [candidate division Zixibacteria bacterium]
MLRKYSVILSVLLLTALFVGCSDRGTDVTKTDYSRFDVPLGNDGGHVVTDELAFTMFKSHAIYYRIYLPPNYANYGEGAPYPVLYLLSPFRGDAFYYFNHGLSAVANRMIAEGEIKNMIIVCIDGSAGFGGVFYGNNYAGGKYAKALGDIEGDPVSGTFLDYIKIILNTLDNRENRAISGFGMGGYGAMRIATEYSENFGSVSACAAPLDFDGANGSGGFIPLFQQIIDELDTEGQGYISDSLYKAMDTAYDYPVRSMMMAAACAFSPHYFYIDPISYNPAVSADTIILDDTLTAFERGAGLYFHLPFDSAGTPRDTVWNRWLENNLENILAAHPDALDNTQVQLFTLSDGLYGFNEQTESFAAYLSTVLGTTITPYEYSGYPGYPANEGRFVYDILPAILKFHSDNFVLPEE